MIIGKVVTKYKSLHDVVSCKRLYFHIIEFLFKNEDNSRNFCSLNRLNCNTNFDQQVLEDLMDKKLSACIKHWGFFGKNTRKVKSVYSNDASQVFNMCPMRNIN